jgi:hypothetical protein
VVRVFVRVLLGHSCCDVHDDIRRIIRADRKVGTQTHYDGRDIVSLLYNGNVDSKKREGYY